MSRHKFIASLLWAVSLFTCAWAIYIQSPDAALYQRGEELAKVKTSLEQVAGAMNQATSEQRIVEQAAKNLDGIVEGSTLIESRALHIAAFFSLLTFGLGCLNVFSRGPGKAAVVRRSETEAQPSPFDQESIQSALAHTIEELDLLKLKLKATAPRDRLASDRSNSFVPSDEILAIESQLIFMKSQAQALAEQNAACLESVRKLSTEADDATNFAAASRLEWNALSIRLNQFKESQGKVRGEVDAMKKSQDSVQELLRKSLEFSADHTQQTERAKDDAHRMNEVSRSTTETFDKLIQAIGETSGDVSLANKLIKALAERASEIVNIIDVIDDIAEQTNQLALNASIEAARAGEQGKGFAVVAAEVRNLAVRSSTATRSITELLETIQAEADQASSCLEKTNNSVVIAQGRIVDVDKHCREASQLSRQIVGAVSEMIRITGEHVVDVQNTEKLGHDVSRMTEKILRRLDEVDEIAAQMQTESNQLAVQTDRISRLMSRQYFAIQYAERLTQAQQEGLKVMTDQGTQTIAKAQSLRTLFENQPGGLASAGSELSVPAMTEAMTHIVEYCQTNLDIIRGRSLTVGEKAAANARDRSNGDNIMLEASQTETDVEINAPIQKAG